MGESVRERVTYRDATHKKPIHIHPLSAMIVLMVWTVFWSKWTGWVVCMVVGGAVFWNTLQAGLGSVLYQHAIIILF